MSSTYRAIAEEIIHMVMGNYAAWRIGITHAPEQRKDSWASRGYNVSRWRQYPVPSHEEAWQLYRYFTRDRGILRDRPVNLDPEKPVFIYVF